MTIFYYSDHYDDYPNYHLSGLKALLCPLHPRFHPCTCSLTHAHGILVVWMVLVMTDLESQQSDGNFGRYPLMLIS